MIRNFRGLALLLAVLALPLAACGGDSPTGPTTESVAGSYRATTLTVSLPGASFDLLALGATLDLVLNRDGTMTGALRLPDLPPELGESEDPTDLNEDLAGSWRLDGSTVILNPTGDTLLDGTQLRVNGRRLGTTQNTTDGSLRVVLEKR